MLIVALVTHHTKSTSDTERLINLVWYRAGMKSQTKFQQFLITERLVFLYSLQIVK
jgi:hypothetical protein